MSDSLPTHVIYSPWNSPGQITGVGSLSLLQGIFPTQGSNPGLLHCRRILYQLSHKGSLRILEWGAYPFSSGSSWPRNWTGVSCLAGGFLTNWAYQCKTLNKTLHIWQLEKFHWPFLSPSQCPWILPKWVFWDYHSSERYWNLTSYSSLELKKISALDRFRKFKAKHILKNIHIWPWHVYWKYLLEKQSLLDIFK